MTVHDESLIVAVLTQIVRLSFNERIVLLGVFLHDLLLLLADGLSFVLLILGFQGSERGGLKLHGCFLSLHCLLLPIYLAEYAVQLLFWGTVVARELAEGEAVDA